MVVSEFIGLDVGEARTGFARGNSAARLAEALPTVPTEQAIDSLKELIVKGVDGIVVGLPRSMNGGDTEQTTWVRAWVDRAKKQIAVTFYWQDEALTTKIAEAQDLKSEKIKDIDSLAARIILQDFLDSPEDMRVVC
ncbi:MAG TPA: Holliday junction resolvase RuvX [Candidatus Saccharimonadales bacterium]|nr:Holliday junction resolvase RuvX [Candidatus Saccharimonadales bacterium]